MLCKRGGQLAGVDLDQHKELFLINKSLGNPKLADEGLLNSGPIRTSHQVRNHDFLGNAADAGREVLDILTVGGLFHSALIHI